MRDADSMFDKGGDITQFAVAAVLVITFLYRSTFIDFYNVRLNHYMD